MDAPLPQALVPAIIDFLEVDKHRPPGRDVYQDIFSNPWMFPLQRQKETAAMMRAARGIEPTTVFEIGTDKAGGLYHWCKCLPSVKNVIACEIRGTPYRDAFEKSFPHLNFLWHDGVSSYDEHTIARTVTWLYELQAEIDILFIDGCKAHFENDFDSYLPHMRNGGIVFMHDITDSSPREAFRRIVKRGYASHQIINIKDATDAILRQESGAEAVSAHENWLRYWQGRSCGVGVIYI